MNSRDVVQAALLDLQTCADKWSALHRRGEGLLSSFYGDIASVVEPGPEDEAPAERSIRDQVGGITAPSRGLSASSLQAEKRLSDLRAVMDELGRLLTKMEDIVTAAKRTAGSYGSQELLLRGRFGAQQSVMDRLHLMAECLSLHQSEYELKESIVGSLTFSMSSLTLTTHLMAWKAKPFAGEWQRTAASVGSS